MKNPKMKIGDTATINGKEYVATWDDSFACEGCAFAGCETCGHIPQGCSGSEALLQFIWIEK